MLDPDITQGVGRQPTSETMAAKKKPRRAFPPEYKREVVKRILAGRESGKETLRDIAADIKVGEGNLHNWLKATKKGKPKPAKKTSKASNGVPRATPPSPTAEVPIQAQLAGALAAIEQAGVTIRALRRVLYGGS